MPTELKAILRYAAFAATADQFAMAHDRYSKDLEAIKARGVNVIKTPEAVLQAQLEAWTKVIDANKDPFFVKVLDSQRAWAKRVSPYFHINNLTTADLQEGLQALLRLIVATAAADNVPRRRHLSQQHSSRAGGPTQWTNCLP